MSPVFRPADAGGMAVARRIAALLALALAVSPAALAAPNRSVVVQSSLERGVLVEINAMRARHHLSQLRFNAQLTTAARAHSRQMAEGGYFAHESLARLGRRREPAVGDTQHRPSRRARALVGQPGAPQEPA